MQRISTVDGLSDGRKPKSKTLKEKKKPTIDFKATAPEKKRIKSLHKVDFYELASKLEKEYKNIKTKEELEVAFPAVQLSKRKNTTNIYKDERRVFFNLEAEEDTKQNTDEAAKQTFEQCNEGILLPKRNSAGIPAVVRKRSSSMMNYNELKDMTPKTVDRSQKIRALVEKLPEENKKNINFEDYKVLFINANLIIRHLETRGEIYLGSNQYKFQIKNLDSFDAVFNVIGEFPEKTFPELLVENVDFPDPENINNNIKKSVVTTESEKKVLFYVLEKESYVNYPHLSKLINKHLILGDKILIHCQQGLVRSATLLAAYLRRYYFPSLEEANEFIGLKREGASATQFIFSTLERLLAK